MADIGISRVAAGWPQAIARLFYAILLVLLVARFFGWANNMMDAAAYAGQIDYGEGIVWQQAAMILRGEGYKNIATFPHIVFEYPPVFHLISGLLAQAFGLDQLAGGRITSALSTLGVVILIGLLVDRGSPTATGRLVRCVCAGTAGLLAINILPIALWSATDRVDMLAVFLTLLGAYYALLSAGRMHHVVLAAGFFVMAIFTKPTVISAPLAAFMVLLIVRPRSAWLGFAATAVMGLAATVSLQVLTGGGFLVHVMGYNINHLSMTGINTLIVIARVHAVFIILAVASAFLIVRHLRARCGGTSNLANLRRHLCANPAGQAEAFAVFHLLGTTLMLATLLKTGSNFNYMIEWLSVICVLIGLMLRSLIGMSSLPTGMPAGTAICQISIRPSLLPLFPALLMLQLYPACLLGTPKFPTGAEYAQSAALVDMIRQSNKPVISDNMVAVLKAGKQVFLEPVIIAELTARGKWDEREFLQQIGNHEFGFFVTMYSGAGSHFRGRYSPAVWQAIEQNYPVTKLLAGHTLRLPRP